MIDVRIEGVGLYTMSGLPDRWLLSSEGPGEDGLYELAVSCPEDAEIYWLRTALMNREVVRLSTPAHVVTGPLRSLDIQVLDRDLRSDRLPQRRRVIIRFDVMQEVLS